MKELSIEEKAKAYDEALENARQEYNTTENVERKQWLEELFPELVESEDEKIRKELIFYLRYQHSINENFEDIGKWIAWLENIPYTIDHEKREGFHLGYKAGLEKQGEQKPIINVPPREVILAIWDLGNEWKELTNGSISTEYGTQLDYIQKHWHESEYYLREKQGGQKPTDKDMVEALRTEYEKGRADAFAQMQKEWSEEDEKMVANLVDYFKLDDALQYTEKQVVDWLKSLKGRAQLQPNQEWSEEDQNALEDVREAVVHYWGGETQDILLYWLKSLKQRIAP